MQKAVLLRQSNRPIQFDVYSAGSNESQPGAQRLHGPLTRKTFMDTFGIGRCLDFEGGGVHAVSLF
jgi:hypothetical protein